jgi:hypothetical protein
MAAAIRKQKFRSINLPGEIVPHIDAPGQRRANGFDLNKLSAHKLESVILREELMRPII